MLQMEPLKMRYPQNKETETLQSELLEYQTLKVQVAQIEERLEELCTAIEDFGLACAEHALEDDRVIYCRAQSYTPQALLAQARQEADLLEQTTCERDLARERVLSKILFYAKNNDQFLALRFACLDWPDCIDFDDVFSGYLKMFA